MATSRVVNGPQQTQLPTTHTRRGVTMMTIQPTNISGGDVAAVREALLRHRAVVGAGHLKPVDRNAMASRAHFKHDTSQDELAQHLRWSNAASNGALPENDVLQAAKESYDPISPQNAPMQINIQKLDKSNRESPLLLINGAKKNKMVSAESRPLSSSSNQQQQQLLLPGPAALRKQIDIYQRGSSFLPQSSTKYFYKPEHAWLVKRTRDRQKEIQQIQQQNEEKLASKGTSPAQSRSGSARMVQSQSQQQRLISATSSVNTIKTAPAVVSIPHVTVVDFNDDDSDQPLKITSASPQRRHLVPKATATLQQHPRITAQNLHHQQQQQLQNRLPGEARAKKLRELFSSYDDFKKAAEDYANRFPKLPTNLSSSPYLNEAKQRQIWCWLHYGEDISDVEYLLSVC